jgi:pSer/pThr/pTyr-binding forkhead associated (FHA) protein
MTVAPPPSGQRIVDELVNEMETKRYRLVYRSVAPPEYHVYLHPADYALVEGLVPLIVADAQLRLTERVETLNRRRRWTAIAGGEPPIEVPSAGWSIAFHADANDEIAPGGLGIESRLFLAAVPRYDGTATVRIARTVINGTSRRTSTSEAEAPPVAARGFATLTYRDDVQECTFVMRKEQITIGRGGSEQGVDVQVMTGPRVSREHCRIRRDAEGRLVLQDLSTWGTFVDGIRVTEGELPRTARIRLADLVDIDFTRNEAP